MTENQWPPELAEFYENLTIGDAPRAGIAQTRQAVLEARKWKWLASGLAACCALLLALSGFALTQRGAGQSAGGDSGEAGSIAVDEQRRDAIADATSAAKYDVMAVYIHRDTCGTCRKMGNVFAELQQDLIERRVLFVKFDLSDPATTRQSQLLGDRLKINEAIEGISTGKIVLLNVSGERLETLDGLAGREFLANQIAIRAD